jgi:hypothetical protein
VVKDNPYFDHNPIRGDGILLLLLLLLLLLTLFLVFYMQDYLDFAAFEESRLSLKKPVLVPFAY